MNAFLVSFLLLSNNLYLDGTAGLLRAVDEDCTQHTASHQQERSSAACRQSEFENQRHFVFNMSLLC